MFQAEGKQRKQRPCLESVLMVFGNNRKDRRVATQRTKGGSGGANGRRRHHLDSYKELGFYSTWEGNFGKLWAEVAFNLFWIILVVESEDERSKWIPEETCSMRQAWLRASAVDGLLRRLHMSALGTDWDPSQLTCTPSSPVPLFTFWCFQSRQPVKKEKQGESRSS